MKYTVLERNQIVIVKRVKRMYGCDVLFYVSIFPFENYPTLSKCHTKYFAKKRNNVSFQYDYVTVIQKFGVVTIVTLVRVSATSRAF